MEQTTFYAIKQQPLSSGKFSQESELIQSAQQTLRQAPIFYDVLYKESDHVELNTRFFHNARELGEMKKEPIGGYIKTSKTIAPLFIKANEQGKLEYVFSNQRPKQGGLVGYLVGTSNAIQEWKNKVLPLPPQESQIKISITEKI